MKPTYNLQLSKQFLSENNCWILKEENSGIKMSDKTWLTFMNSSCMTEAEIKSEFCEFGDVMECDGAIGGTHERIVG